ncbi:hypothetical protein G7Y79_00072g097810 [Physcia stellaris]|nr:hypothetical protein G7Y79_00072g097810 [Physcia stellaris]
MSSNGRTSNLKIDSLPNEILEKIFLHVPGQQNRLKISLVCRRFWTAAQPVLYHDIELCIKPRSKSCDPTSTLFDQGNVRIFNDLIKLLETNSGLQNKVKLLSIVVLHHSWYEDFENQSALIEKVPCLRSLELSPPPHKLDLSRHTIESLRLSFERFRCSSNETDPAKMVSTIEHISRYFWLNSLRNLEINSVDLMKPNQNRFFPRDKIRTSPITHLRLLDCDDKGLGVLPDIFRSVESLQSFIFEINISWDSSHDYPCGIIPHDIGHLMNHHADTLVELAVACSDDASFSTSSLFGSLAHFTRLKRLGIPETFLVRREDEMFHQLLPENLEIMQLQHPMGRTSNNRDPYRIRRIDRLKRLARDQQRVLPRLRRLIWWEQQPECWTGTRYGPASDMQELMDVYHDIGVTFEFLSCPFFDLTPFAMNDKEASLSAEDAEYRLDLAELYSL